MSGKFFRQVCLQVFFVLATIGWADAADARQFESSGAYLLPVSMATVALGDLPFDAQQTIARIRKGGPYPYRKDGAVFGNYEQLLPVRPRGHYHEFTVASPVKRNRGAQRIIVGGMLESPHEFYYTADHYATFIRIIE